MASLTRISDVIMFSAAIPGQGGEHHIHERWPSYWAALFETNGFVCFDLLRDILWYDHRVEWWYAQNMLLFVNKARADLVADLQRKAALRQAPLDIVHPRCFETYRTIVEVTSQDRRAAEQTIAALTEQASAANSQSASLALEKEAFAARLAESEQRNAALTAQLAAIHQSTSWRTTSMLRSILNRSPRLRRILRVSLKLLWWTVTGRLPGKIQEWVRRKTRAD